MDPRGDTDVSTVSHGVSIVLACNTGGADCVVITASPPNDMVPLAQSQTESGGSNGLAGAAGAVSRAGSRQRSQLGRRGRDAALPFPYA
jgi:hypothetical protein